MLTGANQTALNTVTEALDLHKREYIVADLKRHNHMLLRNHDTLTVGTQIEVAFLPMFSWNASAPSRFARWLSAAKTSASPRKA